MAAVELRTSNVSIIDVSASYHFESQQSFSRVATARSAASMAELSETLRQTADNTLQVNDLVSEIAAAAEEHNTGITQVHFAIICTDATFQCNRLL